MILTYKENSPRKNTVALQEVLRNRISMGKTRRRMEDVVQRDTSQILGIRGWRRRAEEVEEWWRLLKEARVQKGL